MHYGLLSFESVSRCFAVSLSGVFAVAGLLSLACLASPLRGEEWQEPRFVFETGPEPWRGERLELPPGFAPDLGWSGVEHIRFSPGMFQADAPDFFSYIIVFLLEPGSDVSLEGLERETLVYYQGLSKSVMGGKGLSVETGGFAVDLARMEPGKGKPLAAADPAGWTGTLDWVEPFATQKEQTLHFEIHTWMEEGRPVVLSCVSPIPPESDAEEEGEEADPVWRALREISARFRFEAAGGVEP